MKYYQKGLSIRQPFPFPLPTNQQDNHLRVAICNHMRSFSFPYNILDMFANEHGEIDVERIISDLPTDKPIEMDLRQLSPILPNRVLLITKEDLDIFLKMIS